MKKILKLFILLGLSQTNLFAYIPKTVLMDHSSELLLEVGFVGKPQWEVIKARKGPYNKYLGISNHKLSVEHIEKIFRWNLNYFNYNVQEAEEQLSFIYEPDLLLGLRKSAEKIDSSVTFVLHSKFPHPDNNDTNTVLQELDIIRELQLSNTTFIIDNIHHCGAKRFDSITINEIINALLSINPNFTFVYDFGGLLGLEEKACLVAFENQGK